MQDQLETSSLAARVPVLVITGSVGVGKTSVGYAVSSLLTGDGIAHVMVNLDCLRHYYPIPAGDPFNTALGWRNLAATWVNFRAAGAICLILTTVVESHADVAAIQEAVPGADILVVRLQATLPTILHRLDGRETGEGLAWHRRRAAELVVQMERDKLEDLLVDTEGKPINAIAVEIRDVSGWPGLI